MTATAIIRSGTIDHGQHRQRRAGGEGRGRGQCGLHRPRRRHLGEVQFVAGMGAERVLRHQLHGHLPGKLRRQPAFDIDAGQFVEFGLESSRSSPVSRAMSAFSVSDCELTETYSPAAIDMAPATSPAMPAIRMSPRAGRGGGDPDDQAGGRDDAVIGAEHGGAQPADPLDRVAFGMEAQPAHGAFCKHISYGATEARGRKPQSGERANAPHVQPPIEAALPLHAHQHI